MVDDGVADELRALARRDADARPFDLLIDEAFVEFGQGGAIR